MQTGASPSSGPSRGPPGDKAAAIDGRAAAAFLSGWLGGPLSEEAQGRRSLDRRAVMQPKNALPNGGLVWPGATTMPNKSVLCELDWTSLNVAPLAPRNPLLNEVQSQAERTLADDPIGSLVTMRWFAEALTHATAASFGSPASIEKAFFDVIRGLDPQVPERIVSLLHDVRPPDDRATHAHADDHPQALTALQVGPKLANWFHTTVRARGLKAAPLVIPPNPAGATAAPRAEQEAHLSRRHRRGAGAPESRSQGPRLQSL